MKHCVEHPTRPHRYLRTRLAEEPASNPAPLIVPKARVGEWLLLEELDKQRRYEEQLVAFEERYQMPFEVFEHRVTTATAEVFTEWDDYTDWQAARAFHTALQRTADIRRGHFQVV